MNPQILGNIPRETKYDPDLARRLNEECEGDKPKKPKENQKEKQTIQQDPQIISSEDYWTISGVNYRKGIYSVNLMKSLLDGGNKKTQYDWAEYSRTAQENNLPYTADMPLHHSVIKTAYEQRDHPDFKQTAEEIRQFIHKTFREGWPTTLTRIAYQPNGKDKIIHNYSMPNEYSLDELIVGPDREIEGRDKNALKAILGTDNLKEIQDIYQWLNQTPTWIWRVDDKPINIDERVAWFGAGSNRTVLGCDRYPSDQDSSLGVFGVCEANARDRNSEGGKK
jgi:hypothetical protein